MKLSPRMKDITNQKFVRLTAIRPIKVSRSGQVLWVFECECGKTIIRKSNAVLSGNTKSCGCYKIDEHIRRETTHGMKDTPEYKAWSGMRSRVFNKNNTAYKDYGGRNIKICDRWEKFENFYADMGPRPTSKHTLDRVDVNGNYEPSNCRWATRYEQNINQRRTKRFTYNGQTLSIPEWAKVSGINYICLRQRLLTYKWPAHLALTIPSGYSNKVKGVLFPKK